MTLQEILAEAVGPTIIKNGATLVSFEEKGSEVLIQHPLLQRGRLACHD